MLEIEEVTVNWCEGAEYAYQVWEPFEWKQEDPLDYLVRVRVVHVEPAFYDYVLHGIHELPEALLAEIAKSHQPHCFIMSDGEHFLAVDTIGYSCPIRKSRLRYQDERVLRRYIQNEPIRHYPMFPKAECATLFTLTPATMVGLTRAEREKKQLLIDVLYGLKKEKKAKIYYYYIEFDHASAKAHRYAKKADVYTAFVEAVKWGWTTQHDYLLALFLQRDTQLQVLYDARV